MDVITTDYYHSYSRELLNWIPRDAGNILEIGCASGMMGRSYKLINPSARYCGLEINSDVAEEASAMLDQVWLGNADHHHFDKALNGTFDCLIYGDSLEHMIDPWAVLRRHVNLLHDNGIVVASIPNIQHWSVIADLISGRWQYMDSGILDRTHLRFFTLESIKDMFTSCGLEISDVKSVPLQLDDTAQKFMQAAKPLLKMLGKREDLFKYGASAGQYIVRASKKTFINQRYYFHAHTIKPQGGVTIKRVHEPLECFASIPGVRTHITDTEFAMQSPRNNESGIVIFHRKIFSHDDVPRLKQLIDQGYIIVTDLDDDPDNWPEYAENDYLSLRAVHGVVVSTPELAKRVAEYNPHVFVYKNHMTALPQGKLEANSGKKVNLFFGALNRQQDWMPYIDAINEVLLTYETDVFFHVVHDKQFFDALKISDKMFSPTCDYKTYLEHLRSADICLMPLNDNQFNRAKSDIKWVEAAASRCVALAGSTVYANSIEEGETGMVASTTDEFVEKLSRLITNHSLRESISERAFFDVSNERMHAYHFRGLYDWYAELSKNRDQHTNALLKRAPRMTV
jgi:2-polyprenyl-3-methyl-5-hydroxy-6-metoxy-1,4-benzoquinol methylase